MKKLFSVNNQSNSAGLSLLIARVGIATLMLTHGIPKLFMLLSGSPVQFPSVFGMSPELSLGLAVFAEVVGSLFILAGFATRLAAVPLIVTMVIAATVIHGADPLGVKEPSLLYLLVYSILFIAGSGKYSVDYLFNRKTTAVSYTNNKVQQAY